MQISKDTSVFWVLEDRSDARFADWVKMKDDSCPDRLLDQQRGFCSRKLPEINQLCVWNVQWVEVVFSAGCITSCSILLTSFTDSISIPVSPLVVEKFRFFTPICSPLSFLASSDWKPSLKQWCGLSWTPSATLVLYWGVPVQHWMTLTGQTHSDLPVLRYFCSSSLY